MDRLASVPVSPQVAHGNGASAVYLDLIFACTWVSPRRGSADDEYLKVRWSPVDALPTMPDWLLRADRRRARRCDRGRFRTFKLPNPMYFLP